MYASILRHARPYSLSAARNLSCSSSVHRSRTLVMVYGFRTLVATGGGAVPELSGPPLELLVRSDPDGNPEATPIALPFDPAASPAAPVPDGTFCWPAPGTPRRVCNSG